MKSEQGTSTIVDTAVDTGFDGFLTITPEIVLILDLPFREIRSFELANGQSVDFAIYDINVSWDGSLRQVTALVTDGGFLLGMSLLQGDTLFIDAIDGGDVRISART
ncbi:MAG: hypothetical protein ABJA67_00665 [Chthonomonadales bacterium]